MPINNGVGRIGIRSYVAVSQQITTSTLLNSLYSVWNADTLGTSLDSSIFGAWNGDGSNNLTVKNAWNTNGNLVDSKSAANGTIATPSGTTFVTGTMSFGTGKLGSGAITFSGNNFVSLPNGTLTFTGDFSVSCWIYVPTSFGTNYSRILSTFDNSAGWNTYRGWDISYSNGTIGFYIYPGLGTDYYGISVPMTLKDQWVHVSLSKVLGQQGNIYINGVAGTKTVDQRGTGSSTQAISYNTNNLSYIGSSYYAFSQPYYTPTVAGGFKIDSIQTWDIALNQTALTELYNGGNGQEYPFTVSNALIGSPKDSISTNHGTLVNGTTFTTGKVGQAFSFDGVNDYVELPSSSLRLTGDFTISCWFYMNTQSAYNAFVENFYAINISNRYGWALYYQSGKIRFGTYNLSTAITQGSTTISTGQWYHLVVTKTITGNPKIYINGVLESSTAVNSPTTLHPSYNTNNIPRFGVDVDSGGWGGYLNGKLDAVTTWTKEISPDEVVQLYNAGNGTQYPFTSQTLPSSANQFAVDNATLMNGTTFTDGKVGKAFLFDGVNDYVEFPNNSLNFNNDFSVSFWIYNNNMATNQNRRYIACSYYSSGTYGYGWQFARWGDGKYVFYCFNGDGGLNSIYMTTEDIIPVNQWTHITITRKWSTETRIYVNGVYKNFTYSTGNATINPGYSSTMYCTIGALKDNPSNISSYINGKIDAVNVWTKQLTQAEVTELYNSGNGKQLDVTSIVTSGLVLNLDAWRKSSYPNTGTTWYDISGNGYNGTLTNDPVFGTACGGQITFDGVNDYVNLGTLGNFGSSLSSNSITMEFAFKSNYTAGIKQFGTINSGSSTLLAINFNRDENDNYSSGKTTFSLRDNNGLTLGVSMDTNIYTNSYFIVTISRNLSTNQVKFYVNGIPVSVTIGGTGFNSNPVTFSNFQYPFTIGASNNRGTIGNYLNSSIPFFRVYNKLLSDTEVLQNFNATKSRFGL